jgi:hypothetical protein
MEWIILFLPVSVMTTHEPVSPLDIGQIFFALYRGREPIDEID